MAKNFKEISKKRFITEAKYEEYEFVIPVHAAAYIQNDDPSGLSDEEITEIDEFVAGLNAEGIQLAGVQDGEPEFHQHNDINNLGGDCVIMKGIKKSIHEATQKKKLTKKQFTVKFMTEKLQKLSGKKVIFESPEFEQSQNNPVLDKKQQKEKAIQDALKAGAIPIEKLKKGDIFSFPGREREYYFNGFNRHSGKYTYYRADDINAFGEKKKGTLVMP